MVDDQDVDMPVMFDKVLVSRLSNTVTVSNKNGASVECDWNHDICTVHVSGWYFGKTAGMFGRYDNEPTSDIQKPSGESVSEIYKMADSWGVSSQCSTLQNLARRTEPLKTSKEYEQCAAHFKSARSPFRPCFSLVRYRPP